MEEEPIAGARANLSEITNRVRLQRIPIRLTRRGTPQATVIPVDVGDLIEDVGGLDAAAKILKRERDTGAPDV